MTGTPSHPLSRRAFLAKAALAAGGCGLAAFAWARYESHWLTIRENQLVLPGLHPAWTGRRLVQISDLHIGPRVSDEYLLESFRKVENLSPDIVVYTGDFTSFHDRVFEHAQRIFPHLPHGKQGTFGILGNHDYGPGWSQKPIGDRIAHIAEENGITILRNQLAEVDGLQVIGLDDWWARQFHPRTAMKDLDPARPGIALTHNPDTADLDAWNTFSGLILAGHTHGGQCKAPFLPPPLLPVKNRTYTRGFFSLAENRQMYINPGLGYLIRARFNVRPEVTLFHLQPS